MMGTLLYFTHYALLLIFGVVLCAAFSGVVPTRKNLIWIGLLACLCGTLQLVFYVFFEETTVVLLYPFITHLPILLTLYFVLGRPISASVAATASAYLCCQPAKWFGLAVFSFSESLQAELATRIAVLALTLVVLLRWFSEKIALIYNSRRKNTWVFAITPVVYYLFDYSTAIYSTLWTDHNRLVIEFLPFFLCIGHLSFCAVYHREFQLKTEAERKEQLLQITLTQQTKEVETIRRSEEEIRLLRHDLKLFLNSLSACVEQADKETAAKLISSFSARAEASSVKRYCQNMTLNYVLSDYAAQCRSKGVQFLPTVKLSQLNTDEILFSSILANALDNALNAQEGLPANQRCIRLMLKNSGGKVLLCIKNTFREPPLFRDDVPVATRPGHGYGTQSIRYITEKLGGNCQFSLEPDQFVLRVVV